MTKQNNGREDRYMRNAVFKDGEAGGGTKKVTVPKEVDQNQPCPPSNWPYGARGQN